MFYQLEQFLFYFLFFAIPFQTRKILYHSGWYFNEWQSVSVYASDLILLALFVFWAVNSLHRKFSECGIAHSRGTLSVINRYDYFLLGFLASAAISVKNSSDFYVGVFLWLKLAEFSLLYLYIKTYAIFKFDFVKAVHVLLLGGLFQAIIAIGQFLKQGSLGLILFGESTFGPDMTGVASFFVDSGEKVIRAYGTTPHPNVLAAYLLLSVFAFYFSVIYSAKNPVIYWAYPVILAGFFFTFSRTIIFLWAVGVSLSMAIGYFNGSFKRKFLDSEFLRAKIIKTVWLTAITCMFFVVFYQPEIASRLTLSAKEEAVQLRVFYNEESLKGGINLFGIGLGDFTGWLMEQNPNLPVYVYQPVHNIYLLIYTEIGIVGFSLFMLFLVGLLYEFIKKLKLRELKYHSFILITLSILFMALFDHFLLTIQQGRFVFWLSLALLAIGTSSLNKRFLENGREEIQ